MIEALITLIIFCFLGTGTPGPNNIMLMTSGMNYGLRRSVPHVLGVAFGVPVMVIGVGIGLAQAFSALPWLEDALKYVCAAYLLYLAYKIATARPKVTEDGQMQVIGKPLTIWQAAAFQWVNPKAWFIVTTALSVYAPPAPPMLATLIVAGGFALSGNVTGFTWTALGERMRIFFSDPLRLRIFNTVSAILLLATLIPVFWPNVGA
ncbi:MAG: LysE family translocator [Devosiaceae bacterium]